MELLLERYATEYGLGMRHPDIQKYLPSQDPETTLKRIAKAEEELREMTEAQQALQIVGHSASLSSTLTRIAEFHALAHDLNSYAGVVIGYSSNEESEGFHLYVGEEEHGVVDDSDFGYSIEVATASKHGGLEERHRPGLELRRLFSLRNGLMMSTFPSRHIIYPTPLDAVFIREPQSFTRQEMFDRLNRGEGVTYLGELIPERATPATA